MSPQPGAAPSLASAVARLPIPLRQVWRGSSLKAIPNPGSGSVALAQGKCRSRGPHREGSGWWCQGKPGSPALAPPPRDHPRGRICCLPSSVSSIGQPIETASRAVQPLLDGSGCRFFCCLASLGSFLAIIPRRQRWRVLGLGHEPQHSRGPADRELSRPRGQRNHCEGRFLDAGRGSGLTAFE